MTGEPAQYIKGKTIQEQMMQILKMLRDQADAIQEQIDDLQGQIDDIGGQTIAPIVDGTTPAMRAIQDESGNNIEQTYATLDSLTDGSVTKVGTANVGTDTKPIKLVGGVPTAVTNDLVDVSSAQDITSTKTFKTTGDNVVIVLQNNDTANTAPSTNKFNVIRYNDTNGTEVGRIDNYHLSTGTKAIRMRVKGQDGTEHSVVLNAQSGGDGFLTAPYRAYNSANVNEVVTIGSLASNPNVMHTTGNENVDGTKRFSSPIQNQTTIPAATNPGSSMTATAIQWIASDESTRLGSLYFAKFSDGRTAVYIELKNTASAQDPYKYIALGVSD